MRASTAVLGPCRTSLHPLQLLPRVRSAAAARSVRMSAVAEGGQPTLLHGDVFFLDNFAIRQVQSGSCIYLLQAQPHKNTTQ